MYQPSKCPHPYFCKALKFYLRVCFPVSIPKQKILIFWTKITQKAYCPPKIERMYIELSIFELV